MYFFERTVSCQLKGLGAWFLRAKAATAFSAS